MPPRKVLKKDHSEVESDCCIHILQKKLINRCTVQPVCRLSWAKCFVTSGVESAQIEL